MEKKVFIKIDYGKQLEAELLSNYINSLNKELRYFLKDQHLDDKYSDKLYIKKIKEGSLEIFPTLELLVGATIPFLPQMQVEPILFDFMKTITKNLELFKLPENININKNRSSLYFNLNLLSQNTKSITYNSYSADEKNIIEQPRGSDALLIENNLKDKLKEKEELEAGKKYISVPFYWDNAKFTASDKFNFKGCVDGITTKPLYTIWENDNDRKYMTEESHLNKPWQELNYVVDLEVQKVKDSFCYKILNIHRNQTFYMDDEA